MTSTTFGACPLDCPDTCSWVVTVQDGKAVSLRGNREHPFTRGALCVKVNRYLEHARAADRILYPMRRVGPKGSGRFERISWDEALSEIATRLHSIIDEYGGEAIWPYQGTGTLGYIQGESGKAGRRFWNVLGASKHDMNICSRAGNVGLRYVNGTPGGMDPETFALSKLILLWGTNPLTSGHHVWKFIQEARAAGAYVVAIDPIRTRTADQADEHLPIRPGTDAALALGLLHVVLEEGAEDRDFIERYTLGWEEFQAEIRKYPVDRVAEITGLPAERIRSLGVRLAHTRPTGIRVTMGIQRHAGGGAALRAIACIPGVTGDWRYPGGGLVYSTSAHARLNVDVREDLLPKPVRTLTMTRLASSLDETVKCLWVYGANPVGSSPDQNRIRAALQREDLFTVVMEHFPTDTVDYADIVLPATMQIEHMDLHAGYGHMYLIWNEPAVEPPGECLSTTETFRRLARHMGLTEPCLYDSDLEIAEQLLSTTGISLEELRKKGWARLDVPDPFLPFADGFPTPSGRLEFVSARAEADGQPRVPGYTPSLTAGTAPADRAYPLTLITPAQHMFLNTTFGNNPELLRRSKGPKVLVNEADAKPRGLVDGQLARVFNRNGEFTAYVEITDRVRPGVVAAPKGHWPKLSPGGANPNAVVDERDADMGKGAVFHDNFVDIAPAG
ncbi:molybdopterin oxidoreductase [Thermobispora bispora]|mgnify:FL=1|uniref:Molybdopterin oxidoreductase n=1 Tax=Thermobispora bispora (strain ATCC 19993 / DSM 43833 / CBS 139.67 / JCM 10125 / KCTC 9307 / NBRC 14880 / R51) TaxID=469371 RepID=D6Y952_THEBD|nr:molybdopterin oxidoreductase family protein [Thermobispora bispora]MBO2476034.1 molybdopterin oxidoreductase family protein [Actinomycetales bacterium]MDI9579477.1 molybdopterin oxidoreductase family protein [Thermobispora sp.]ADG90014.1 molybdopterin oxidoreductase [Thermobispora bispora DSM 43833]MBX6167538.1 molybdopterin oxidoreductase family protein [Thermobispora bispora]QSI46470.1 molybdopterin oxidoreductase family protein [Thermobispora bispora]